MLGEIETYCRDMHWSGSLSGAEAITLSHRVLPGAGAVHPIIYKTGPKRGVRQRRSPRLEKAIFYDLNGGGYLPGMVE